MRVKPFVRFRIWGLLLVAALGFSAAACGGDDESSTAAPAGDATETAGATDADAALVDAATKEGKVTVYSSQGLDQLNNMVEDFKKQYPGIQVEVVRGIDSDLAPKIEAENQTGSGTADLFVNASLSWVSTHAAQGWFLPVAGAQLTGKGDYDAAQFVHEGNYFEVSAAVLTYAWNNDLYSDGIDDYEDLLDPKLDGKLGVIEPTAPSIVDFYLWLEETFGEDYVEKLAALNPRIYPSALPIGEALASGEISATPYAAPSTLAPLKDKGAPVEFGISDKGAWGARFFGMIPKTAPHPNAGQLLANYMVTAAGQTKVAVNSGTVAAGVDAALITNDKVRKQDLAKLTPDAVAAYQAKWNGLFR